MVSSLRTSEWGLSRHRDTPAGTVGGVAGASLVAAAAAAGPWGRECLPVLGYLGRISYGLYVFHRLCYVIAESLLGKIPGIAHYFVIVSVAFCLALALAGISYRFFEQPFLHLKKRFTFVLSDRDRGPDLGTPLLAREANATEN